MYIPTNHRNKQAATAKPNNHHLQWKSRVTSKHPKKRRSETIRRLFSVSRKVCEVNIRGNNVTSWHTSRPDSFLLAYGSVMGKFPNQQIFTGENMLALVCDDTSREFWFQFDKADTTQTSECNFIGYHAEKCDCLSRGRGWFNRRTECWCLRQWMGNWIRVIWLFGWHCWNDYLQSSFNMTKISDTKFYFEGRHIKP